MRRATMTILLICAIGYVALNLYAAFQLRRAGRLISAVEELPIGTAPSTHQIARMFPGLRCTDQRCYTIVGNLPFSSRFAGPPRYMPPRILPANWWYVIAQIGFDAQGNVMEKSLGIDNGQYHQDVTVGISVHNDARLFDACGGHPGVATHPGYLPRRQMRTGALAVDISPLADKDLNRRAFDIHLDCLNTINGCETPGDIAPTAWRDTFITSKFDEILENCRSGKTPGAPSK